MSSEGTVTMIRIRGERTNAINTIPNAYLKFNPNRMELKIYESNETNKAIISVCLEDCSYVDESSSDGIDCIRMNNEGKCVIIIDKNRECERFLKNIRQYLKNKGDEGFSPDDAPAPSPVTHKAEIDRMIREFNAGNIDQAKKLIGNLASQKAQIRCVLDVSNENGNDNPPKPPKPTVVALKLKMKIESHLIEHCTEDSFEISILPNTSVQELKEIVERDTGISKDRQYWFINRDPLANDYKFGSSSPRIREDTVLILYIAKNQEN